MFTAFGLECAQTPWHCLRMHTVTLEEARQQLDELVAEAGRGGEIIITLDHKPVAKLAAAAAESNGAPVDRGFGALKGKIDFREGWNEPIEDFKPYTE